MAHRPQGGRTAPRDFLFFVLYFINCIFYRGFWGFNLFYIYITQGFLLLFIIMFFKSIIYIYYLSTHIYIHNTILSLLIISTIYEIVLDPCGGIFLEV